jgi:hypothetical protein
MWDKYFELFFVLYISISTSKVLFQSELGVGIYSELINPKARLSTENSL